MNIDIAILGGMGPQAGANYFKILTDFLVQKKVTKIILKFCYIPIRKYLIGQNP